MKKQIIPTLALCVILGTGLVNAKTITDAYNRTVEVPDKIERIACTGSGALRIITYLQAQSMLAGIEDSDKRYANDARRDYAFVNAQAFQSLTSIGKGGGTAYTAYPEALIAAKPDVIFTGYSKEATEQLARETGLPVISIRYISEGFVDESFNRALTIAGNVLNRSDRAQEVIDFIDNVKSDLSSRTKNIPSNKKTSTYTGAVTFSGAHGFAGTYSHFGPFDAVGAKNVADTEARTGYYEADLEQILQWNPQVIFLDPGNLSLVKRDMENRKDVFAALMAFETGKVYTMPSFNNYSTNITYCLMNGYWAGKVLFPEAFHDIDMKTVSASIMTQFLGRDFYDDMARLGLYYGKLKIE